MSEYREALQRLVDANSVELEEDEIDDPRAMSEAQKILDAAVEAAKALLARPEPHVKRVYIDEAQTCTVIGEGQFIGHFTSKPRHATDVEFVPEHAASARPETSASATDDELRSLMRAAGGHFHGPRVEHLSIPETAIFAFLRSVLPDNPKAKTEPAAAEKAREPLELLEEADKFIQGFAGSTEAGFARKARADRWRRRYSEYISSIPLPSPPAATGETNS